VGALEGPERVATLDSDLAESISALKEAFARRGVRAEFGQAEPTLVASIKSKLSTPRRFREFLLASDPIDVETRTPSERVRLVGSGRLLAEQVGFALGREGERISAPGTGGWRPSWVIVGHSTLLGDPYFLDVAQMDAEGDCPVYTAMSGKETWKPRLCASSFAMFLRILALGMEVAGGFADDNLDFDDEQVFRESLGPRIREYDPAALKAGHWT
jgi:hypothetical protein